MPRVNERRVFDELLRMSQEELRSRFTMEKVTEHCYRFEDHWNKKHYVSVATQKTSDFGALVNADFGFDRDAGSNNYSELLNVGRHFADAFDIKLKW